MSEIACNSQPVHGDHFDGSRPKRNDVINTFPELWKFSLSQIFFITFKVIFPRLRNIFRIFSLNVLSLKSEAPSEMHFESSGEPNDLVKKMVSIL